MPSGPHTLGLRRVKQTVNFDEPSVYHLYYGDEVGTPGSVMTYFPFPNIGRGRPGTGEVGTTVFSVPEGSLGFWQERLAARGRQRTSTRDESFRREAADTSPAPTATASRWSRTRTTRARRGRRRRPRRRGHPRLPLGLAAAARRRGDRGTARGSWATSRPTPTTASSGWCAPDGNGANFIDLETLPGVGARRSRRRLGAPHRLRGATTGRRSSRCARR